MRAAIALAGHAGRSLNDKDSLMVHWDQPTVSATPRHHKLQLPLLLNWPRSPQQQVAHLPGQLVLRLVLHHLEQQRQLKFVMSRRRRHRWPIPMHHQRVLGVQSSSSTAGQRNIGAARIARNWKVGHLGLPRVTFRIISPGQGGFRSSS